MRAVAAFLIFVLSLALPAPAQQAPATVTILHFNDVYEITPLSMSWCLDCHRNPGPNRRPISEVTNMKWTPPRDMQSLVAQLDRARPVNPPLDCSGCHR